MSLVRRLTKDDAEILFPLRLRALKEHPEAFGASYEDELSQGIERWRSSIEDMDVRALFGAFLDERLVGMVLIYRNTGKKQIHRMGIGAMYVAEEAQGHSVGQALLEACIDHAKQQAGVKFIDISVTVGNNTARRLYRRNGFVSWGVHPDYLMLEDGSVHDLEALYLKL